MSVDLRAERAARALERSIGAIPVPAPDVAIARARRHHARTLVAGATVAATVLLAAAITVASGSPESAPKPPDAASPDAMDLQHFDVVRSVLTVDAADVRYDQQQGDGAIRTTVRHVRAQRCMQKLGYQVPDLVAADYLIAGGRGFQGFEDLEALRTHGIQGHLPDTPYQEYLAAITPNAGSPTSGAGAEELGHLQSCTRTSEVTDVKAAVADLRQQWLTIVAGQEAEPAIAGAKATVEQCLRARGYAVTVAADGESSPVTDGSLAQGGATAAEMQARSLAIGRDLADCLEPLVAARTTAHRRARETFLAQHGAEVTALQEQLDEMVDRLRQEG